MKNKMSLFLNTEKELEEVKNNFLWLVYEISEKDWDRKIPDEAWTAKEEMFHIVQALEILPKGINLAVGDGRRSILSILPSWIRTWVNGYLIIPNLAKRATRESIINSYEKAFTALVGVLERLPEEDWGKGAKYPRKYRTVEQMAHRPKEHFNEHRSHLYRKLGIMNEKR
jgi:hypothetical protein